MTYKALGKWMPTPIALIVLPFALIFGVLFAAFRFLFYLEPVRWFVDRAYFYVVNPLWRYACSEPR